MGDKVKHKVRPELRAQVERIEMPFKPAPGETEEQWYACCQYVLLGSRRTLIATYRLHTRNNEASTVPNHFRRWFMKYHWTERTRMYDANVKGSRENLVTSAVVKVRKAKKFDYEEVFDELKRLILEDLQIDGILTGALSDMMEKFKDGINVNLLKDLVAIRRDLVAARKMSIEQASAIYGFGVITDVEGIEVTPDPIDTAKPVESLPENEERRLPAHTGAEEGQTIDVAGAGADDEYD